MIMTKSVVYTELAEELNEEAQLDSNVRRIQRLIAKYELNYVQIALLTSLLLPKGKWELSLDRTPIWFELLDNKGGNSTQEIRVTIFDKLIRLFGIKRIKSVYGDREFIGEKVLS